MYEYFGGVTRILVPDNTMTAVIYNNDWYNQELNTIYHEMAEHYNTAIIPARVRAPRISRMLRDLWVSSQPGSLQLFAMNSSFRWLN